MQVFNGRAVKADSFTFSVDFTLLFVFRYFPKLFLYFFVTLQDESIIVVPGVESLPEGKQVLRAVLAFQEFDHPFFFLFQYLAYT